MTDDRLLAQAAALSRVSELEVALAQATRLESIGRLAAGIAHEINTPVQFVSDNTQFLSESFEDLLAVLRAVPRLVAESAATGCGNTAAEELRQAVERADLDFLLEEIPKALKDSREGISRVAQIVRAMKDFSHPGSDRVDTDINRSVESTVQVSRNEWKYVADVVLDLDHSIGAIPCFEGEIKQALLNVIVNAAHAIEERRTDDESAPPGRIEVSTRTDGDSVVVAVSDNGAGMTAETRRQAFDPFFTTKPVGKGTGQGLSLAHTAVVVKHGGRIGVTSRPGHGTTITFHLPCRVRPEDTQATAAEGARVA